MAEGARAEAGLHARRSTRWPRSTTTRSASTKRRRWAPRRPRRAAARGGSADAVYNQGIILWNQGKIPEAKVKFEEALKANPNHAESTFQMGMALLNEGKLPDAIASFEKYLQLAPTGQFAAQAKGMLAQLKKCIRRTSESTSARAWPKRPRARAALPPTVRLIAVSKTFPIDAVRAAYEAGQRDFGENRVQEALQKIAVSADLDIRWHLIGHLQSNKARKAAEHCALIHSVDSVDLLRRLDEAAAAAGRTPRAPGAGGPGARNDQTRRPDRPDLPTSSSRPSGAPPRASWG